MKQKIFLITLSLVCFIADASASYYYLKFGTTLPPIHQKGYLPSLGFGGRLKSNWLDFDLSLTGSSKKKSTYLTAKGLLLFFTGQQVYIGAGAGIGYSAKSDIIKLVKGGPKTTTVNLEGVIGIEMCGKFMQVELSNSIYRSHNENFETGVAFTVGTAF